MQTNLGGATNPNSAATSASKNPECQSINRSVDHKFVLMQRCRIIKGSKFSQRSNACRCNQLKEPSLLIEPPRQSRARPKITLRYSECTDTVAPTNIRCSPGTRRICPVSS